MTVLARPSARRALAGLQRWAAGLPLVAAGVATLWSPADDGFTLCPVALMTGTACPGCGLSRAVAWLLRGDVTASVRYHPLAIPIVLGAAVAAVWWAGTRRWGWRRPSPGLLNGALISAGLVLIGVWVARLATGNLPPV